MPPLKTPRQLVHHSAHHPPCSQNGPNPAQDPHVSVLVTFVCFLVSGCSPQQLDPKESVFDGCEIGIAHDDHDMLDVESVRGLGPVPEHDCSIDDGRDGKGEVVILEPFWAEKQEESSRDGGDEDAEGHGGVVEEAC